jgi:rhamnogalacturonan endolyase
MPASRFLLTVFLLCSFPVARAQPIMERLDRGVVAVPEAGGKTFVSWRVLASDPDGVAFNVYRTVDATTIRLNPAPLAGPTWLLDADAPLARATTYTVRAVLDGREIADAATDRGFTVPAVAPRVPYHAIKLQTPEGYTPNDASVGDLNGDGRYEIVLHQTGHARDNSQAGPTDPPIFQAYTLDGKLLWTIDLGKNIREGAHYTQFLVYDFDGDGRAEFVCKTADGTVDGVAKVIGDANADWREPAGGTAPTKDHTGATATPAGLVARLEGRILRGPEYLTVFDGLTGAALATVPYVPRRHPDTDNPTSEQLKAVWGDAYGNRSDRFLACVAYLDGTHPSIVMCRGYYTRTVLAAWDWREGKLTRRWIFDSDDGTPGNEKFRGQGNHNLSVADVDGDGRDEIIYGACVIDDDGKGLYSTGWGHGDAIHVGDLDPENPGLEVMSIQERFDAQGINVRDARTARAILTVPSVRADTEGGDKGEGPGRGNAFNIDPRFPGAEVWAAGAAMDGLYTMRGEKFLEHRPRGFPCNFGILWDGDLLHELLDSNRIVKWNWKTNALDPLLVAEECVSDNGTKSTPALSVDLWGDWREEVIWRTRDNQELHIYTSTIPTKHRLVTLMHDPQYRLSIAWQNVAYNQPPHPSFYLDESAPLPPKPRVAFPARR